MDNTIITSLITTSGMVIAYLGSNVITKIGIEKKYGDILANLRLENAEAGKRQIELENRIIALEKAHEFDDLSDNLFSKSIDLRILNNKYIQKAPYNSAFRIFANDISKFCMDYDNWKARKSEEVTKDNLRESIKDRLKLIHDRFDEPISKITEEKGYFVNNKLKSILLKDLINQGKELLGFNKLQNIFIEKLVANGYEESDPKLRAEFYAYFDAFYNFTVQKINEFEDMDSFEDELEKI